LKKEIKMNKLLVPSLLEAQADIQTAKASQSVILVSAWVGTLLLSRLPQIVLSELGVMNPSDWSLWWWIMMGIALFAITYVWAVLKPFSDERIAPTKARCAGSSMRAGRSYLLQSIASLISVFFVIRGFI
jgi:hypothetical protein